MGIFKRVEKDPDAIRTYTIDYADGGPNDATADDTGWLQTDTISTSAWTLDTGITADAEANTTTTASVKISGGVVGRKYKAVNRIVTVNGETDDRTLEVQIVQK